MAIAIVAYGQDDGKSKKPLGLKLKNVSLGISPSLTTKPNPSDFTIDEFTNYQGNLIDLGLSANIYGQWNLRAHLGYIIRVLDPSEYFDQVLPFEEIAIYNDVNGFKWAWSVNGIVPESFIMFNLGVSRNLRIANMKITPYLSAWCTNERPQIIVDGYEVIATGEYVDETFLAFQDFGITFYPSIGLDIEIEQYVFGFYCMDGDSPMPSIGLRLGYLL